jgi:hypothetical protein
MAPAFSRFSSVPLPTRFATANPTELRSFPSLAMTTPDDEAAQPPLKRPRREPQGEEVAPEPAPRVELNPADCDLGTPTL